MSRYNGASVFKSRLFETQGKNRKTEITQMKYKKVQGVLLITNSWHAETLQKTINCDRIVTGKIIFNVISDVKGNMKISKTEVAKKVLLALMRGGTLYGRCKSKRMSGSANT